MSERDWLGLELVEAPAATRGQLERVHSAAHVDSIEAFSAKGGGMIDVDTVASEGSWEAAQHAAGGAVHAAERLLDEGGFAFCGLRPPGHHAERDRAMGFCLFNNVAVAAAHAIAECGAERVLILDWDVHHGNGTEAIFYGSSEVLYSSIHQSPLYPGTGAATDFGSGAGEGRTVNLPVPPGSGPDEFLALVQHVVAPIAREWSPDLLCISAGYDAHRDDPLANCEVDDAGLLGHGGDDARAGGRAWTSRCSSASRAATRSRRWRARWWRRSTRSRATATRERRQSIRRRRIGSG